MYRLFILLSITFIFSSCKDIVEEVSESYPSGSPMKVIYYDKNDPDKTVLKQIEYYPNGNKKIEGEFKDGKRTGQWTYWFENGNKWSEGTFKEGLSHGKFTIWYESGKVFYKAEYYEGNPDGLWTYYNEKDKPIKEVTFEKGKKLKEKDIPVEKEQKE